VLKGRHQSVPCASCHKQPPTKRASTRAGARSAMPTPPRRVQGGLRRVSRRARFARARSITRRARSSRSPASTPRSRARSAPRTPKSGTSPAVVDFRGARRPARRATPTRTRASWAAVRALPRHRHLPRPTFEHPRFPEFFAGQHAGVAARRATWRGRRASPARRDAGGRLVFKNRSTPARRATPTCTSAGRHRLRVVSQRRHAEFAPSGSRTIAPRSRSPARTSVSSAARVTSARRAASPPARRGRPAEGAELDLRDVPQGPHLGQVGAACERCHTTTAFKLADTPHPRRRGGLPHRAHTGLACRACHKPETGAFPGGSARRALHGDGHRVRTCHQDAHRGALGDACEGCHAPDRWRNPSRAFHRRRSSRSRVVT